MAGRGTPGVEPQMEKREEFARFIRTGVSISEAARRVGVNRKTGMRWCHGRTITTPRGVVHHYPSVLATASEPDVSARYLSEDERTRIADLTTRGAGVREIARDIGRSPSTVSRELRRNTDRSDGSYRPFAAHRLATTRRARSGRGRIANDEVLRRFVCEKLKKRWSPAQISHALREEFVDEPERHLVAETIGGFHPTSQHMRCSEVAMAGRGRPGVEPQMEKREEFARFIRTGAALNTVGAEPADLLGDYHRFVDRLELAPTGTSRRRRR